MKTVLITQIRDRHLLNKVLFQNKDFLFRGIVLSLLSGHGVFLLQTNTNELSPFTPHPPLKGGGIGRG